MLSSQKLLEYHLMQIRIQAKCNPKFYIKYAILLSEAAKMFNIYRIDEMQKGNFILLFPIYLLFLVFLKLYPANIQILLELAQLINQFYMNQQNHKEGLKYLEKMIQLPLKKPEKARLYYSLAETYQKMGQIAISKSMAIESLQNSEDGQLLLVFELLAQLNSSQSKLDYYQKCLGLSIKLYGKKSPTYLKYVHLCNETKKQFDLKNQSQISRDKSSKFINLKRSYTNKVPLIPLNDYSRIKTEENQFTSPSFALSTSASNRMYISRHIRNTTHIKANNQTQSITTKPSTPYQLFYINNFLLDRPNNKHSNKKSENQVKIKVQQIVNTNPDRQSISIDTSMQQRFSVKKNPQNELIEAAIKIQRQYRKRQHLKDQKQLKLIQNQQLNELDNSSSIMTSQEVDSINDLIDHNNEEQNDVQNPEINQLPIQTLQYKRSQTNDISSNLDNYQHRQSILRKIGRNSIKFVISNTANDPISPSKIPQRISFGQPSRGDQSELSDLMLSQQILPLYRGIDHLDHVQAYFRNMSVYLNYQNLGLSIFTIKGIETSVIFSQESQEPSSQDEDTSRKHHSITIPQNIQMVILIESAFYIGPLLWRISYDKKLFRQRKCMSVFQFTNSILTECLEQNDLTDLYKNFQDQLFFYASSEYQNQEESVLATMLKLKFFLMNLSYFVKQQNGQDIKQFMDKKTMHQEVTLQQRISKIKQHQKELKQGQRVFNSSLSDIRVQQIDKPSPSSNQELEDPIPNIRLCGMTTTDKFKDAQKQILLSIKVKNKFTRMKDFEFVNDDEPSIKVNNKNRRKKHSTQVEDEEPCLLKIESSQQLQPKRSMTKKRFTTVNFEQKFSLDQKIKSSKKIESQNKIESEESISQLSLSKISSTPQSINLSKLGSAPIRKSMFSHFSQNERSPISPYLQIPKSPYLYQPKNNLHILLENGEPTSLNVFMKSNRTSQNFDETPSLTSIKVVKRKQLETKQKMKQTVIFTPRNMFLAEEDSQKIVFQVLYSKEYLTVSRQWRVERKQPKYKNELTYFNEGVQRKVHIQRIYLNPFRERTLIFLSLMKKESSFFLVSVYLHLNEDLHNLNQQVIQQKNKIKVNIKFRSLEQLGGMNDPQPYKTNMSWEDELQLNFGDFIKWFVGSFNLSQWILKQGYNTQQKLNILGKLNENICIQDCKLKVEYFGENQKKIVKKKTERKHVFNEIVQVHEEMFKRDYGRKHFEKHFDLFLEKNPMGIQLRESYKYINEQRAKQVRNVQRKNKRLIARIQKSKYITQYMEQDNNNKKMGPQKIYLEEDDQTYNQQHLNVSLKIPSNLHKNILHPYNTFKYLMKSKYLLQLEQHQRYTYMTLNHQNLLLQQKIQIKFYCPFQKQTWWKQTTSNSLSKNKIYNILQIQSEIPQSHCNFQPIISTIPQSKIKTLFLSNNIKKELLMNGIRNTIQNNFKYRPLRYYHLEDYITTSKYSQSIEDRFKFINLLKIELLQQSYYFLSLYFQKDEFLMMNKFKNLGRCFVKYQLYLQKLNKQEESVCIVKIEIMKKTNMKYNTWKILLGNSDLKLLFSKITKDITIHQIQLNKILFIDTLQNLLSEYLIFIKQKFCKIPAINPNIYKFGYFNQQQSLFYQQQPWVNNFPYNHLSKVPYNSRISFFHNAPQTPELVYITQTKIRVIQKNILFQKYDCNNLAQDLDLEKQSKQLPAIISVYQSIQLQQFILLFYFPLTQRQFITQLNFTDLYKQESFEQLKLKNIQKWVEVLKNLTVFIGDQKKIYINISQLKFTNEFKEILFYEIKNLANDQQVLIIITIQQSTLNQYQYLDECRQILITNANDYKVFITLQWVSNQQKIQAVKLDFPELLMGYYKKQKMKSKNNMFRYKFNQSDLKKFSGLLVEMIILNWSSSKPDLLRILFPFEKTLNYQKKMKINTSFQLTQLLQIENNNYVLMYRAILMKNILVAIFFKKKLYILMQRLVDGKTFLKKIKYKYVETYIPGFVDQVEKGRKEELGKKLFELLRNQMIADAFHHF